VASWTTYLFYTDFVDRDFGGYWVGSNEKVLKDSRLVLSSSIDREVLVLLIIM